MLRYPSCIRFTARAGAIALVLFAALAAAQTGGKEPAPGSVDFLLQQNENARRKIRTADYTNEWVYSRSGSKGHRETTYGRAAILRRGDHLLSKDKYVTINMEDLEAHSGGEQIVMNDRYYAHGSKGYNTVFIHPHASAAEPTAGARTSGFSQDILRKAYLMNGNSLREVLGRSRNGSEWKVEKPDRDNPCYRLVHYRTDLGLRPQLSLVITFDPGKDFNIVKIQSFRPMKENKLLGLVRERLGIISEQATEYERVGGAWFPIRWMDIRYHEPVERAGASEPESHYTIKVTRKKVNEPVEGDPFTLKSLEFKSPAEYYVYDAETGKSKRMKEFKE